MFGEIEREFVAGLDRLLDQELAADEQAVSEADLYTVPKSAGYSKSSQDGEAGVALYQALADYWFMRLGRAWETRKGTFDNAEIKVWKPKNKEELTSQVMLIMDPIPYPEYIGRVFFKDRSSRSVLALDAKYDTIVQIDDKSGKLPSYGPLS